MDIRDEELVLFHYRDGLDAARLGVIERALRDSPRLRQRYQRLVALLAAADDVAVPEPDQAFEQRIWTRLAAREHGPARSSGSAPRRRLPRRAAIGLALAASLILAIGFQLGRLSAPPPATDALASRVLDAYVAAHLRATQGVLLTTLNAEEDAIGSDAAELAAALVDNNRLYAAAAAQAGNRRLAEFLREIEPLLIELANPPDGDDIQSREGLRDYVRESDTLFKLRAVEARLNPRGDRRA